MINSRTVFELFQSDMKYCFIFLYILNLIKSLFIIV